MADDESAEPELQAAGGACPHCPSPPECRCPDTPAVCRTGECGCGPECPCRDKPEPPWWDPCKRRRWRRAHGLAGAGAGAGWGPRRFGCLGGVLIVLIVLGFGLWLVLRSDGNTTGEKTQGRSTTTTSTRVTEDQPEEPSPMIAIEAILRAAGITGAQLDAVLDAVGPVDDAVTGPGTNVVEPRPAYLDPILEGSANVTLPTGEYRVFVTQTAGPLDPSVQWGIGVARDGAPLSQPSGSDLDYLGQFPSSAIYVFDTLPGDGPVERFDPTAEFAAVPTTAMYYVIGDTVAVLIPIEELAPGGSYATQIFLRATPPGAAPSESDPTAWTAWARPSMAGFVPGASPSPN